MIKIYGIAVVVSNNFRRVKVLPTWQTICWITRRFVQSWYCINNVDTWAWKAYVVINTIKKGGTNGGGA